MAEKYCIRRKKKEVKLTLEDIFEMAFVELGLTEDQFFSMPPFRTYMMQLSHQRKRERNWEQTRELWAIIHNASMGTKRKVKPQHFIKLPFDKPVKYEEWTRDEALDLINKWSNKN